MNDYISRQAAIDALNGMKIYRPLDSDRWVISDCINKIVDLPSAQPERIHGKTLAEETARIKHEILETFSEQMNAQPERKTVSDEEWAEARGGWTNQPERKKGKWIDDMPWIEQHHSLRKGLTYRCSECGHRTGTYKHKTYNYCPNCGADMRT